MYSEFLKFEQIHLTPTEWFLSVICSGQKKGLNLADTNNTRDRVVSERENERKSVCVYVCVCVCLCLRERVRLNGTKRGLSVLPIC